MSRRMVLLARIGRLLAPGYRFKWPEMAWWDDAPFTSYLRRFDELDGFNTDRRWNLFQLVKLVEGVPGDTAECGVYRGATSYLICWALQLLGQQRPHHAFDSFAGLSEPAPIDGRHWRRGDLSVGEEVARAALADFDDVRLYRGWIPERFAEVADRRFAFVHIDVDLHRPTLDSLEFFYTRMAPGGLIVSDDYGFTTCPGVTAAFDQFFADKAESVVGLADGGGFVIVSGPSRPPAES